MTMARRAAVAVAALVALFAQADARADTAAACAEALVTLGPEARRMETSRFGLAYRLEPGKVAVGKPFAIEIGYCAKGPGMPRLSIDAEMPDHRHGMNYRPRLTVTGPGRARVEGMVFHMPGRWDLLFDLEDAAGHERLRDALPVGR